MCTAKFDEKAAFSSMYVNEVIDGDKELGLRSHQVPVFLDERGRALKEYVHGSKVLDRICKSDTHNFALCDKDKI